MSEAGTFPTARRRMELLAFRAFFDEGVRVEHCVVEAKLAAEFVWEVFRLAGRSIRDKASAWRLLSAKGCREHARRVDKSVAALGGP